MKAEIETVEVLKREVAPVAQAARELRIITPADYAGAAEWLKTIKGKIKRVDEFFAPMVAANLAATRATNSAKAEVRDPLIQAEGAIKQKQIEWQSEQEAIRRKEQSRLQAEADERARREREALLKKAAALKTPEKAEALREQAAAVIPAAVHVASVAPEVKGQSLRKTWRARVVDAAKVPREWLVVNQQALDSFARSTKGAVAVAGVEMFEETTLASSSR